LLAVRKSPTKGIKLLSGSGKERQDITILRAGRGRGRPRTSRAVPRRLGERRSLDDECWPKHSHRHGLRGFHRSLDAREQRQRD